jgi:hypothetical protein
VAARTAQSVHRNCPGRRELTWLDLDWTLVVPIYTAVRLTGAANVVVLSFGMD